MNRLFRRQFILFLGLSFGLVFWILSAAYDHSVMGRTGFLESLVAGGKEVQDLRVFALALGLLIGAVGQAVMTRVYQHDRPRILFDQVNDALILINGTNGDIVKANKKASMLLGYPHKQLESLSVAAIHPHDLNDAMEFLERVLRDGHGTTDKFSCKTRSGELIPAELSAGVVPIAGKPHVLISIRDVSHQIVTQERLRELVDAAERANRQKSEFLASISHDLRTELNAIIGFSTMIETEMLGKHAVPAYRDYASHIKESGEHLLDLVNESFDRSKIKTGKAT